MIKRSLIFFLGLFIFIATPSHGAVIEIASVSAHYAHPINQTIEDSGNNVAIGQGMCESVLDPQALIETTSSGQVYGTFRLHLKEQIGGYHFSVQNRGDSDFYSVAGVKMKEDSESVDFRIPLPSKTAIIRFALNIKAMGRDVIFYGAILDCVEGNTDFITSVDKEKDNQTHLLPKGELSSEGTGTENLKASQIGEKIKENRHQKDEKEKNTLSERSFDGSVGLLLKGDPRLSEEEVSLKENAPYGPLTVLALYSFFIVFGVLAVSVFILGLFLMYYAKRLRFKNDKEEELLYDFEEKMDNH